MKPKYKKGDSVIPQRTTSKNYDMVKLVGMPCTIFEVYHHGYVLSEDTRWLWLEEDLKLNIK